MGQLVLLTTILNHKPCINTSRQVLEKILFAINVIFTQDNNLSKTKVEGSLQKTNATCSKCKTNLILTYHHRSRRYCLHNHKNVSPRSCQITTNYFQTLIRKRNFWSTAMLPDGSLLKSFSKSTASERFMLGKLFSRVPSLSLVLEK